MFTLFALAEELRDAVQAKGLRQAELAEAAGISKRTLTHALSGQQDIRLTTLMALADRLGLEVMLVPKAASGALPRGEQPAPPVQSVVSEAREALYRSSGGGESS